MALTNCPKCGNVLPPSAEICPCCGCPVSGAQNSSISDGTQSVPPAPPESPAGGSVPPSSSGGKPPRVRKRVIFAVIAAAAAAALLAGIFSAVVWLSPAEQQQVQAVASQIQQIGDVDLTSEPKIRCAESAYDGLSGKCQRHVGNREVLFSARDTYDTLCANVVAQAISSIGSVTPESAAGIASARSKYDHLTDAQKEKVSNYPVLTDSETALSDLQVSGCASLIDSIGTVSLDSRDAITAALDAYDSLSDSQKSQVGNYDKLTQANTDYRSLCVQNCIALISQIGEVTLDSGDAISAAEDAYEALSIEDRNAVSNYSVLKAAQDSYSLQKAAAEKEDLLNHTIRVTRLSFSKPNSAGGVDLYIGYTNLSQKVIKYVTFTVTPYNAVGDVVHSQIGYKSTINAKDTGPRAYGEGLSAHSSWHWDCAWYSWQIDSLQLSKIYIEYMDGSTCTLTGDDISAVMG